MEKLTFEDRIEELEEDTKVLREQIDILGSVLYDMTHDEKTEKHNTLHDKLERLAMNSNYGLASSCCDDEKLVVLCMINKQLKDMQEILTKIHDKI